MELADRKGSYNSSCNITEDLTKKFYMAPIFSIIVIQDRSKNRWRQVGISERAN